MMSAISQLNPKSYIVILLLLQLALYITILFNIPIARQVVGFAYFTFIPGLVIIKLLKFDKLNDIETILFSVGLSIVVLMLIGLLVNELGSLFSFSNPLSQDPLLIALSGMTFILGVGGYVRNSNFSPQNVNSFDFSAKSLILILLPILSVVGAMWVNVYRNNLLLIFTISVIAITFIAVLILKKSISQKYYPIIIFLIALSLLYHSSIISNHFVSFGSDVYIENFAFQTTVQNGNWSLPSSLTFSSELSRVNSMLSVTVLPTIYTSLLNIDSTLMYKLIYPFIFAFVPVALYQMWQMYIEKKYAFISAFLLMAQATFYTEMFGLNRQMIAELFFVLLLFSILSKKLSPRLKVVCFILFSFGLITSHYAIAEIFLFFTTFAFITLFLMKRPSRKITLGMISLFLVMMFVWYIYVSNGAVFSSFTEFGDYVYRQLGDFFNLGSRQQTVLRGLGLEAAPTIWNTISRAFAYITQILIVVGFAGFLSKKLSKGANFDPKSEYFLFGLAAMGLLGALILVPGLANTLNMTRFYHILLFFLAPFCVIGIVNITRLASKQREKILSMVVAICVIVPYFFFQTGFVYAFTGTDSYSLSLNLNGMDPVRLYNHFGYISDQDVAGAQWIANNVNYKHTPLYADSSSRSAILTTYAMIFYGYSSSISNVTQLQDIGILYLNKLNVVDGVVTGSDLWSTADFSYIFNNTNKIYSNGANNVYSNPFR
jgi:uncharacterized membrane protein